MRRRDFIVQTSIVLGLQKLSMKGGNNNPIFGNNEHQFIIDKSWSKQSQHLPVKDCHEMVITSNHKLILLTNETKNNLIAFDLNGKILEAYGHDFPGGHGLTLYGDSLFITDTDKHQFFETSLNGKILRSYDYPKDTGYYESKKSFVPTEIAVTNTGDFYVADGYGMQYIIHYENNGNVKNIFGGKGEEEKHLDNAHGICVDYRHETPCLIVTDRNRCCFKRFSLNGEYIETIHLPGANVCRPVIKGDYLYAAVLTTNYTSNINSGFVVILDKDNKLVSVIGGSTPQYLNGVCLPIYQTIKLLKHPHDVTVDNEGNVYVCQWNSGQVYPIKFRKI
jgi:DNA-binding beta-propeller fold protein YncE